MFSEKGKQERICPVATQPPLTPLNQSLLNRESANLQTGRDELEPEAPDPDVPGEAKYIHMYSADLSV